MLPFASDSRARIHDEHGQATVEFAMILPILCVLLFAVIEFGMAFWNYQQVSAAASEGARRASVSRTYGDREQRVVDAVKDNSPQLDAGNLTVTTATTWTPGDPVTVTVKYPQDITVMGVTFFSSTLDVSRTMRVEQ
ncbi:MAG: pilus assembly protein [Thermoleophilia bacterium]|nr:pilus assembly protein [Thermoleophilia bacterium]